jgi:hypothetical protein
MSETAKHGREIRTKQPGISADVLVVTTIDPRPSVPALPVRLASLRQELAHTRRATSAAQSSHTDAPAAVLAQRIAAIAHDDPERRRKAVRIVLEAELAREFGAPLLGDPRCADMLDAVQQQMQQDPESARAVNSLGDWLLSGATQPG